jgi:hypothetical protein
MAVVALRSAAQNKRRSEQKQSRLPDFEDDDFDLAAPARPEPVVERRSTGAPDREHGEKKKGGLLSRWSELAAELERQMQEQQQTARETQAEARMEHAPPEEPERLVVVPGRRVYPARTREPSGTIARRAEASPARGAGAPSTLESRPHAEPVARRGRRKASGLERLESYSPLKRAIILSEVLNEPPGVSGIAPAERRLGGLD